MGVHSLLRTSLIIVLSVNQLPLVAAASFVPPAPLLPAAPLAPATCNPDGYLKECPANTWKDRYQCLIKKNTFNDLVGCVKINRAKMDAKLCQDTQDTIPDKGDATYWALHTQGAKLCTSARQIILAGSDYEDCIGCLLKGAIQACPDNDPDFWNCLCENNIVPKQLLCIEKCFLPGSVVGLTCPQWTSGKKPANAVPALPPRPRRGPRPRPQAGVVPRAALEEGEFVLAVSCCPCPGTYR